MIRQSPVEFPWKSSVRTILAVVFGTAALAACGEQSARTPTAEPTAPQFAAAPSCSSTPCVVVQVTEKGNNPPEYADGTTVPMIVTLVGSNGPFGTDNAPLKQAIDADGYAVFEGNISAGGYCAWVGAVTGDQGAGVATGGGSFIVPNSGAAATQPGAPFGGAVSTSATKSTALSVGTYTQNCLWVYSGGSAPFNVDASSAVSVTLKVTGANALSVKCQFPDGSIGSNCPTWAVADLTVYNPDGSINVAATQAKIPWADAGLLGDGVGVGILASAGHGNSSFLDGLTGGEPYQVEAAVNALTSSLKDKKPGSSGGKGNKGGSTTTAENADLIPLVCIDETNPAEPKGDVDPGNLDFLTVHNGYLGAEALSSATFSAQPGEASIWYDQIQPSGASALVTIHLRFQPNLLVGTDSYPTTINMVQDVDFAACISGGQPSPSSFSQDLGDGNFIVVDVSCRTPAHPEDPDANVSVTWSLHFPTTRTPEFRLDVNGDGLVDNYPTPDRSDPDITRSMATIDYTTGACDLNAGSIAHSTDPKFWTGT